MDIVERLRAGFMGTHVLTEAADEIERLRQQNAEFEEDVYKLDEVIMRLRQQVAELVEALQKYKCDCHPNCWDDCETYECDCGVNYCGAGANRAIAKSTGGE